MITIARNAPINVDPSGMVLGPKVMLLDEFSASDGDIVAYRFKKHKLGPVIGKRSWGGVVGIRGTLPLLDGGFLNRPEFSSTISRAKNGSWREKALNRICMSITIRPANLPASMISSTKPLP